MGKKYPMGSTRVAHRKINGTYRKVLITKTPSGEKVKIVDKGASVNQALQVLRTGRIMKSKAVRMPQYSARNTYLTKAINEANRRYGGNKMKVADALFSESIREYEKGNRQRADDLQEAVKFLVGDKAYKKAVSRYKAKVR